MVFCFVCFIWKLLFVECKFGSNTMTEKPVSLPIFNFFEIIETIMPSVVYKEKKRCFFWVTKQL